MEKEGGKPRAINPESGKPVTCPTMNEIINGIKAEEMIQQDSDNSNSDSLYVNTLKKNLNFIWNHIFKTDL